MSYHPQQASQNPPLPPPWYAEWDQRDQRWLFVNPETGQRTFNHPHPNYQQNYGGYQQGGYEPQQRGYGQQQYSQGGYGQQGGYGPQQGGYGQQQGYQQAPQQAQKSHKGLEYGALGAVAGVAAGAFAMHEV